MKKFNFLFLTLACLIGSIGQVWGAPTYDFTGKGMTHPTYDGSAIECYLYNTALDAFAYFDGTNVKLTASGVYVGATKFSFGESTSRGSYTYIAATEPSKKYLRGGRNSLNLDNAKSSSYSNANYWTYSGNSAGYVFTASSYYSLYGSGTSVSAAYNAANRTWMLISEDDYNTALHKYYFAANAVNTVPAAGSVFASFVDGTFTAASATGEAGGNGSATMNAYFKATRNGGYMFLGWYDAASAGTQKSADPTYAEKMTSASDVEANPASITRYARYAATTVDAFDEVPEIDLSKPMAVDGVITINVSNAVDINDFNTPTLTNESGSGLLTLGTATYADGVITIPLSFDPQSLRGETSATLTVSAKSGSSKSVTISALVRPEPTCDVEVRNSSDVVISDATTTFAQGIALANANPGSTIVLLRNVDLGSQSVSQTITKSTTLNLNGQILSGSTTTDKIGLLEINGTGIEVTITDRSVTHDGEIRNVSASGVYLYTVYVTKGTLNIEDGHIYCENTNTTANSNYRANGICSAVGTTLNIYGGIIEAVCSQDYPYGIFTSGTTNIYGGEIKATASRYTRGILVNAGTTTMTDGKIYSETLTSSEAFGVMMSSGATGVFNLQGGEIIANSKTSNARGIYMGVAKATVNVSGGSVIATSQTTPAYGYYDDKGGAFTISGGTLHGIACGTNLTSAGDAKGYGASITGTPTKADFLGGMLIGECTKASVGRYGYGLYTTKNLTIDGNCTFKGISAYQYGFGIQVAGGTTTFKNGTIFAECVSDARGVQVSGNADGTIGFVFEGGTITAQTTTGSTARGICGAGNIEVKGGTIVAKAGTTAKNTTSYGIFVDASANGYAGTLTMTGGNILSVASSTTAYGVYVNVARVYTGTPKNSIEQEVFAKATISGGTILAKTEGDEATTTAIGVRSYGNTTIEDGVTVTATPKTTTAYALDSRNGKMTVNGGTFNATGTTTAYGVIVAGEINSSYGYQFNGDLEVNGGTFNATTTTGEKAYGVCVSATSTKLTKSGYEAYHGDYAAKGHGLVNGGIFNVNANTTTAYGVYVAATSTTGTARATPTCEVTGGKYKVSGSSSIGATNGAASAENFVISGGYYNISEGLANYAASDLTIFPLLKESTEYAAGYRYLLASERPAGTPVCKVMVGSTATSYYTLEAALAYVNNNPSVTAIIIMTSNYLLPTGNYTLPSNATLVVPESDSRTTANGTVPKRSSSTKTTPSLFRKLVFADGVHMNVHGTIEVLAQQYIGGFPAGTPNGPYGQIEMLGNSSMVLGGGSKLISFGYVTGSGTIDARRGSTVYECFQFTDWKGGGYTTKILDTKNNDYKVFPVTQYYIQNVEVATKYHPGAHLTTTTGVNVTLVGDAVSNSIHVIGVDGEVAMFLMDEKDDSEDTWVQKDYDPITDQQVYKINSSASLGSLHIGISEYDMNSANYVLPITNNMKIQLLSGHMEITQSTYLTPGSEIEVNKESTVIVNEGQTLYLYDKADWKKYADYTLDKYVKPLPYVPSWANQTTSPRASLIEDNTNLPSATLNIHGTFDVQGHIQTTAGGASILSTIADAGTIQLANDPISGRIAHPSYYHTEGSLIKKYTVNYDWDETTSAQLRNDDGTTTLTADPSVTAGMSFCFLDMNQDGYGEWTSLISEDCFVKDQNDRYYVKPQDYVQIDMSDVDPETFEPNATDHLYYSADRQRTFIIMGDCQCWEVEPTENDYVFHCLHPLNDIYYEYDENFYAEGQGAWVEKTIEVTWKNWDGTILKDANGEDCVYNVKFGTKPQFLSTNPKRAMSQYYTYDFIGWYPAITEETVLYDNAVYIAQFEEKDRMYQITFKNENGTTIETDYYAWNTLPECEKLPTKDGYTLSWSPALGYVSGNQVYTAVWTSDEVDPATLTYTVTWKNFDGTTLQTDENVAWHADPVYLGATPTKAGIADKNFEWDGWLPEVAPVEGNVTYVAKFKETPKKFTIRFLPEEGVSDEPLQVSEYAYYEVPEFTGVLPTKEHLNPTGYYYELVWSPLVSATICNQDYRATFVERPNTMRLIVEGGLHGTVNVAVTGQEAQNGITRYSEILDYNTTATISATATDEHYHFARWSDGVTTNPRMVTLTGYVTYTALYELDQYDITFVKGNGEASEVVSFAWGETPAIADPVRPGYTFKGWGAIIPVAGPATYTAQWEQVLANLPVSTAKTVGDATYNEVKVKTTGVLTVGTTNTLTANTLIIEASDATSGEIINAQNIAVTNAYFDYYFEATAYSKAQANWYAFSVPFEVDAQTGISYNGQHLDYVNDINIVRYNGATRAALGKDKTAIEYIDELPDHTLYPGVLYMAAFVRDYNELPVRFVKKSGADLVYGEDVQIVLHVSANDADANWNGIANPALYKAYLGAGVETGQYYVSGENRYITADLKTDKFPVGKPVYVQAAAEQSLVVNRTAPAAAPMRVMRADETLRFDVRIADGTGKMTDRLFARTSEEADNTAYTIGADVAKAGVSNRVAQMWLSAYGLQLCQETALMDANGAEWSLGISVPTAGDYTISLAGEETEDMLYLTYLGQPVWNLTDGAYVVSLSAGTTNDYGLRVVRARVPGAATSVEDIEADGTEVKKWLIDGKLYIVVGEKVYNATGKLVK